MASPDPDVVVPRKLQERLRMSLCSARKCRSCILCVGALIKGRIPANKDQLIFDEEQPKHHGEGQRNDKCSWRTLENNSDE